MQNASNQLCGDPWLKNGCATNFETRPRFRVIFVIFSTDLFNVFFLQAETPPAAQQNTFYESLRKARRRRHFSVFGSSPKRIDTNSFHQFENNLKINATHLNKNNIFICLFIYLIIYFLIYLFLLLIFIYLFLLFYFYSHWFFKCLFLMFIFWFIYFSLEIP